MTSAFSSLFGGALFLCIGAVWTICQAGAARRWLEGIIHSYGQHLPCYCPPCHTWPLSFIIRCFSWVVLCWSIFHTISPVQNLQGDKIVLLGSSKTCFVSSLKWLQLVISTMMMTMMVAHWVPRPTHPPSPTTLSSKCTDHSALIAVQSLLSTLQQILIEGVD